MSGAARRSASEGLSSQCAQNNASLSRTGRYFHFLLRHSTSPAPTTKRRLFQRVESAGPLSELLQIGLRPGSQNNDRGTPGQTGNRLFLVQLPQTLQPFSKTGNY